jgi:hypothetical protein
VAHRWWEQGLLISHSVVASSTFPSSPLLLKDYKKSSANDKLDLAGLLNVLDGVVDCPGRLLVLTTNHPEKMDRALIRPGRVDKMIHLGYIQPAQAMLVVLSSSLVLTIQCPSLLDDRALFLCHPHKETTRGDHFGTRGKSETSRHRPGGFQCESWRAWRAPSNTS